MDFRIRSNNSTGKGTLDKYNKYLDFLMKFDIHEHKSLWQFFVSDFFHDGKIEKLRFSTDLQNIIFRISCPNIERKDGDSWIYIDPIWFTCRFEGVASFQMETSKLNNRNDPLSENIDCGIFLESEINTLTEQIQNFNNLYSDSFLSIIIKTLPCIRDFSLIFRSLTVSPVESLGFELLKQDKSFKMPLFACNKK